MRAHPAVAPGVRALPGTRECGVITLHPPTGRDKTLNDRALPAILQPPIADDESRQPNSAHQCGFSEQTFDQVHHHLRRLVAHIAGRIEFHHIQ